MLTLARCRLGRARLEDPDPFADLPQGPYKAPSVVEVPGILPCAWERQARPWERRTPRPPEWWFAKAEEWARAAVGALPEAADRFGGYAVACRRRGEVEQMIRDRRTPAPNLARTPKDRIAAHLRRLQGEAELFAAVAPWPEPELDPMWAEYVAACVPWVEGEDLARLAERARVPSWGKVAPLGDAC